MTLAIIIGLLILIICITAVSVILGYMKPSEDNRLGVIMLALVMITAAGALFRVGELPDERQERAKECLDEGYDLDLNGHEIFGGSVDLDEFTVTSIDDENKKVHVITNRYSPDWAMEYNDQ